MFTKKGKKQEKKNKVAIVLGTRPEIIKCAPIAQKLDCDILFSNQHFDDNMSHVFFEDFGYKNVIINKSQNVLNFLDENIPNYDKVLVQGDTRSAFYGALVAKSKCKKLFHIEAGLRTFDFNSPCPEEFYRTEITKLADMNFAPTENNKQFLLDEGIDEKKIIVCGNPIIQALKTYDIEAKPLVTDSILVTIHRQENKKHIKNIVSLIWRIANNLQHTRINIILHPNNILSNEIDNMQKLDNVNLLQPVGYNEMLDMISTSTFVLSDSGGVAEECCELGTQLFILRDTTERQEAIELGIAELIDPAKIDASTHLKIISSMNPISSSNYKCNPYFDKECIEKIVENVDK